jgi:hypothetical protein
MSTVRTKPTIKSESYNPERPFANCPLPAGVLNEGAKMLTECNLGPMVDKHFDDHEHWFLLEDRLTRALIIISGLATLKRKASGG